MMRPDPLAEQPWEKRMLPRQADGSGFFVSGICDAGTRWSLGGESCAQASTHIVWVGCTKGEHAGALELCSAHNDVIGSQAVATLCVQCASAGMGSPHLRVLKREKI